jgi:hypothetical protein
VKKHQAPGTLVRLKARITTSTGDKYNIWLRADGQYTFLPVEPFGVPFTIKASQMTPAVREAIEKGHGL